MPSSETASPSSTPSASATAHPAIDDSPTAEPTPVSEREARIRGDIEAIADSIEQEYGTRSPFERLFGVQMDRSDLEAALNAQLALRADHHTECVRAEGFDWFVEPPEIRVLSAVAAGPLPDDSNDMLVNAYGISSQLRGAVDLEISGGGGVIHERVQALSSMSDAEQAAHIAVYNRCQTEAYDLYPDHAVGGRPDFSVAVGQEISRAASDIAADPGFDAIWLDWSSCMREFGHDFRTRSDAVADLAEESSQLSVAIAQLEGRVPQALQTRLDALARLEHSILLDDLECAVEVDLDRRRVELQHRLEKEALAENADRWSVYLLEGEAADD